MKILFFAVFAITGLFNNNIDPITNALQAGDIDQLATYFDGQIEMAILEDSDLYSKQAAINKLQAFFADHQPTTFKQLHKGVSEGQKSSFFIGDLNTPTASYRIYIYLQEKNGKSFIQELRIDEE